MASDLPTALPAQPGLPRGILRGVQGELQVPNAATSSQSDLPMASGPTITLGGGFSPINGMEFLGQSEAKGNALTKCQRLFNVRHEMLGRCLAHSLDSLDPCSIYQRQSVQNIV